MRRRTLPGVVAAMMAAVLLLAACAGPSPPNPAAQGSIRHADVPAGWVRCADSGSLSHYLTRARMQDAVSAASVRRSWRALQRVGATRAEVTEYVAQAADCSVGLGQSVGASALTWATAYRSAGAAHHGYEIGVLGFQTPDPGRLQPGLTVGNSTGLGADSWTLTQTTPAPPLFVAWWRHGSVTDFLIVTGLGATDANPIALRVDAHMQH